MYWARRLLQKKKGLDHDLWKTSFNSIMFFLLLMLTKLLKKAVEHKLCCVGYLWLQPLAFVTPHFSVLVSLLLRICIYFGFHYLLLAYLAQWTGFFVKFACQCKRWYTRNVWPRQLVACAVDRRKGTASQVADLLVRLASFSRIDGFWCGFQHHPN